MCNQCIDCFFYLEQCQDDGSEELCILNPDKPLEINYSPDQGILNKDIFQKESMKKGIWFSKGDVLFGKLRPYLKNWFLPYFSGLAVGDFWVLYAKQGDPAFLYYLLQTPEFFFISNQSSGSKMPRADWSLVSQYKFSFPSEKTEQDKIGQFFKSLDRLITLHQRERLFLILEEILC